MQHCPLEGVTEGEALVLWVLMAVLDNSVVAFSCKLVNYGSYLDLAIKAPHLFWNVSWGRRLVGDSQLQLWAGWALIGFATQTWVLLV